MFEYIEYMYSVMRLIMHTQLDAQTSIASRHITVERD